MGIDISRLSPAAQKQIMDKLCIKKLEMEAKYRNKKTPRMMPNGKVRMFDSLKEAARYDKLMMLLKIGKIQDLRLQQTFTLQEGYVTSDGQIVRPITYKADFVYLSKCGEEWRRIVEDAKGVQTEKYKIKKKMMLDKFGITISEV